MFPKAGNGLSFLKIIGGLSKTLRVAQEIIPIYEQTKPMIQNARKAFSVLKSINIPNNNTQINNQNKELPLPNKKTTANNSSSYINNPSFFR